MGRKCRKVHVQRRTDPLPPYATGGPCENDSSRHVIELDLKQGGRQVDSAVAQTVDASAHDILNCKGGYWASRVGECSVLPESPPFKSQIAQMQTQSPNILDVPIGPVPAQAEADRSILNASASDSHGDQAIDVQECRRLILESIENIAKLVNTASLPTLRKIRITLQLLLREIWREQAKPRSTQIETIAMPAIPDANAEPNGSLERRNDRFQRGTDINDEQHG